MANVDGVCDFDNAASCEEFGRQNYCRAPLDTPKKCPEGYSCIVREGKCESGKILAGRSCLYRLGGGTTAGECCLNEDVTTDINTTKTTCWSCEGDECTKVTVELEEDKTCEDEELKSKLPAGAKEVEGSSDKRNKPGCVSWEAAEGGCGPGGNQCEFSEDGYNWQGCSCALNPDNPNTKNCDSNPGTRPAGNDESDDGKLPENAKCSSNDACSSDYCNVQGWCEPAGGCAKDGEPPDADHGGICCAGTQVAGGDGLCHTHAGGGSGAGGSCPGSCVSSAQACRNQGGSPSGSGGCPAGNCCN
ncbi:hypothetical protein HY468_00200 [Candidatus Roizmanbacteria bacterium]|nr:hypothetical protein [Candidatus Roizmanbacteria bacterium]